MQTKQTALHILISGTRTTSFSTCNVHLCSFAYLAHNKQILSGDFILYNRFLDGLTNCPLVPVDGSTVQVSIPSLDGHLHSFVYIFFTL